MLQELVTLWNKLVTTRTPLRNSHTTQTNEQTQSNTQPNTARPTHTPNTTLFDVAANKRRRHIIKYLHSDANTPTTTGDLAEHIASVETNKPPQQITSTERKRAYVSLKQTHLDKLTDAGVLNKTDSGGITRGPTFNSAYKYVTHKDQLYTHQTAHAVSLVVTATLVITYTTSIALSNVPALLLAFTVLGGAAMTVEFWYHTHRTN